MEADDVTHRIRQHAFLLWEAAGCPDDRAEEFWFRAREVELGLTQPTAPVLDKTIEDCFPASDPPSSGNFA
jgi:hypothetical protein